MGRFDGTTEFGVGFEVGGGGLKGITLGALGTCVGTEVLFFLCFGISLASGPIVGSNDGKPVVDRLGGSVRSSIVGTGDSKVHIDGFRDELRVNDGCTNMLVCGKTDGGVTNISEALGTITPLLVPHSGTTATTATVTVTPAAMTVACNELPATACPS